MHKPIEMKNIHDFINISFSSLRANSVFLPAEVLKETFGPVSDFDGHEEPYSKRRRRKKKKNNLCKPAEQSPRRFSNRVVSERSRLLLCLSLAGLSV